MCLHHQHLPKQPIGVSTPLGAKHRAPETTSIRVKRPIYQPRDQVHHHGLVLRSEFCGARWRYQGRNAGDQLQRREV